MIGLVPTGRVYESAQQAQDAVKQLTDNNLPDNAYSLMVSDGQASNSTADIAKAIIAGHPDWVPVTHAEAYAAQIQQGRSLLLVTPPFGRGKTVEQILGQSGSINLSLPEPEVRPYGATPFSDFVGIPVLSHGRSFDGQKGSFLSWFFGDASTPGFKFSSLFGMKLLSHNPTPLSSMTGMSPLSKSKGPGDSSFGLPLLKRNNPSPLSSTVGMKPLSGNQGRGDSSFGMANLSKNPTPLSSMLNLPLLSKSKSSRSED